ncbi:hypothetical protein [Hypericibacter sp.]|uniref:hypothetical protein n=1 Tax=Hypericibacter sp. TaxID=2705401 RepID=UPI003D6D051B
MASTMSDDLKMKSTEVHWPPEFSPDDAVLFAHNEVFIHASTVTVWQHIVEAENWPHWYTNSEDVQILDDRSGVLREGGRFRWTTFGLAIKSWVYEFLPNSRIGWFSEADGLATFHTWLLIEKLNGCQVVTEEVVKGANAVAFRDSDPGAMHRAHDLWINSLKRVSEFDNSH